MKNDRRATTPRPELRPVAKITMIKRDLREPDAGGYLPRRLIRKLAGRKVRAA